MKAYLRFRNTLLLGKVGQVGSVIRDAHMKPVPKVKLHLATYFLIMDAQLHCMEPWIRIDTLDRK